MRKSLVLTLSIGSAATVFFGLFALICALLYFSFQPDSGTQVLCDLGSQAACDQLRQAYTGHGLALFAMIGSIALSVLSLILTGIVSLALALH